MHGDSIVAWLGLAVDADQAQCPSCRRGSLRTTLDQTYGGRWYYCADCRQGMDAIELVAAAKQLSVEDAVQHLRLDRRLRTDRVLDRCDVQQYLHQLVSLRLSAMQLWNGRTFPDGETETLSALCVPTTRSAAVGSDSPLWELVGWVARESLERVLDSRLAWPAAIQTVAVSPFYDQPGRISGFWCFAQHHAKPWQQFVAIPYPRQHCWAPEAGLGCLGVATAATASQSVLVEYDVLATVRQHVRGLRQLLPPVACIVAVESAAGCSRAFRTWFPDRRLIFRAAGNESLQALRHAEHADGQVCTWQPSRPFPLAEHHVRSCRSRYTSHWRDAIARIRRQHAASGLPAPLFGPPPGTELAVRQDRVLSSPSAPLTTQIEWRGNTLHETPGGWFYRQSLVCNAVLRIDEVLYAPETDCRVYHCRVLFEHQVLAANATHAELQRPFEWLDRLLLSHALGPLLYDSTWAPHILQVAMQLSPPRVRVGTGQAGWDPARHAFVFPQVAIPLLGELDSVPQLITDEDTSPGRLFCARPAPDLKRLTAFSEQADLAAVQLLLYVLAAGLSRATGERLPPLIVLGEHGYDLWPFAEAYGCRTASVRFRGDRQEGTLAVALKHAWPYWFRAARDKWTRQALQFAANHSHACVIYGRVSGQYLAAVRDWPVIRCDRPIPWHAEAQHLCRGIPAFLRWLCARQLRLPGVGGLLERTAAAWAEWLHGGPVSHISKDCVPRPASATACGQILADAVALQLIPHPKLGDTVRLAADAISVALLALKYPPDAGFMACLEAGGARQTADALEIPGDWWRTHVLAAPIKKPCRR